MHVFLTLLFYCPVTLTEIRSRKHSKNLDIQSKLSQATTSEIKKNGRNQSWLLLRMSSASRKRPQGETIEGGNPPTYECLYI